jgi:hypothetical protein
MVEITVNLRRIQKCLMICLYTFILVRPLLSEVKINLVRYFVKVSDSVLKF